VPSANRQACRSGEFADSLSRNFQITKKSMGVPLRNADALWEGTMMKTSAF